MIGAWAHEPVGQLVVSCVLATPVQFYTGRGFYTGGFKSIRNMSANMDVLVALGSIDSICVFHCASCYARFGITCVF